MTTETRGHHCQDMHVWCVDPNEKFGIENNSSAQDTRRVFCVRWLPRLRLLHAFWFFSTMKLLYAQMAAPVTWKISCLQSDMNPSFFSPNFNIGKQIPSCKRITPPPPHTHTHTLLTVYTSIFCGNSQDWTLGLPWYYNLSHTARQQQNVYIIVKESGKKKKNTTK